MATQAVEQMLQDITNINEDAKVAIIATLKDYDEDELEQLVIQLANLNALVKREFKQR